MGLATTRRTLTMATGKQDDVAKELVKQISRVDSGVASSLLSLESCADTLQGLSKEVLVFQHRYDSLRQILVDKLGEENIEEGFVFVEPSQPESCQSISNDLQKLTSYIQQRIKCESALVVGDCGYKYIKLPEGGLKVMKDTDAISQPVPCQDLNIEEVLQKNFDLVEENKKLKDEVLRLDDLLRRNNLVDAMREGSEASLTSSLVGEAVSSNISALTADNKRLQEQLEEKDSDIAALEEKLAELQLEKNELTKRVEAGMQRERSMEETMRSERLEWEKEKKDLQDEVDRLKAELIASKEREGLLQAETEAFELQADTYKQDFERERRDKQNFKDRVEEMERGWKR